MLIMQFHTSNEWKNASHKIFIQFKKIFQEKIEIARKIVSFFFHLKSIFVLNFPKNFACKFWFFCLHNVEHDAQKLDFFPFLWINFFKQAKNSCFFSSGLFIYALINVWYIIWEDINLQFRSFSMHCQWQTINLLGTLVLSTPRVKALVFGHEHIPKILRNKI